MILLAHGSRALRRTSTDVRRGRITGRAFWGSGENVTGERARKFVSFTAAKMADTSVSLDTQNTGNSSSEDVTT